MTHQIHAVDIHVCRAPIETPVMTSFGNMADRPAVVVRLVDRKGIEGWGEIWCNYPTVGAEHRARLLQSVFVPLLADFSFECPDEVYDHLVARTHVLAVQTAEVGPIAQCIAGIDTAVWDLVSRKAGQPLYAYLGGEIPEVPVYASGINPTEASVTVDRARQAGHRAFKIKIGFGHDVDLAVLGGVRDGLADGEAMMADANQAWSLPDASQFVKRAAGIPLSWLEEPICADRPDNEWRSLADEANFPIAAGENVRGEDGFQRKINSGYLGVIQPDICKWGGISANLPIVRRILEAGLRYCPHYLGGGIGLVSSAHLLAAVGGDGMLELDFNDNPLREGLAAPFPTITSGNMTLNDEPGIGVSPDTDVLAEFAVDWDRP